VTARSGAKAGEAGRRGAELERAARGATCTYQTIWSARSLLQGCGDPYTQNMGLKQHLTPLRRTSLLGDDALDALRDLSITTVEELVGAIMADAPSVARVLHVGLDDVHNLEERALEAVPEEVRGDLEVTPPAYGLGALPPRGPGRDDS
jgi:hypothetical protein